MNWQQIVRDILELTGMSQVELGGRVGCGQAQISDLLSGRRGERISYEIGTALVREHKKAKRLNKQAA